MAVMAVADTALSTSPGRAAAGTERTAPMRIATWNVNSLNARMEAVERVARRGPSPTSC